MPDVENVVEVEELSSLLEIHHIHVGDREGDHTFAEFINSKTLWEIFERLMFYKPEEGMLADKGIVSIDTTATYGGRQPLTDFVERCNYVVPLVPLDWASPAVMNRDTVGIDKLYKKMFEETFYTLFSSQIIKMFNQITPFRTFLEANSKSNIEGTEGYFRGQSREKEGKNLILGGVGLNASQKRYMKAMNDHCPDGGDAAKKQLVTDVLVPFEEIKKSIDKAKKRSEVAHYDSFFELVSNGKWDSNDEEAGDDLKNGQPSVKFWANKREKTIETFDKFHSEVWRRINTKAFQFALTIGFFHILEATEKQMQEDGETATVDEKKEWRTNALEEYINAINSSFDISSETKSKKAFVRWIGVGAVKHFKMGKKKRLELQGDNISFENVLSMTSDWDPKHWRKYLWMLSEVWNVSKDEHIAKTLKEYQTKCRNQIAKDSFSSAVRVAYNSAKNSGALTPPAKLDTTETTTIRDNVYEKINNYVKEVRVTGACNKFNKTKYNALMKTVDIEKWSDGL